MGNNVSFQHKSFAISHCWEPSRCALCGPVTKNTVKFEVYFGAKDDQLLRLCKWCLQDFTLLNFKSNQVLLFGIQRAKKVVRAPAVFETLFEFLLEAV